MDSGQRCKNAVLKHMMLSACPVPSGEEAAWIQHRQRAPTFCSLAGYSPVRCPPQGPMQWHDTYRGRRLNVHSRGSSAEKHLVLWVSGEPAELARPQVQRSSFVFFFLKKCVLSLLVAILSILMTGTKVYTVLKEFLLSERTPVYFPMCPQRPILELGIQQAHFNVANFPWLKNRSKVW